MYNYDEFDGLGWAEGGLEPLTQPLEDELLEQQEFDAVVREQDADFDADWDSFQRIATRALAGKEKVAAPTATEKKVAAPTATTIAPSIDF